MKKIIFLIVIVLTIIGCSSIEKKDGKIIKNKDFNGAVKVRFEGRVERVFLNSDIIDLGREYYLVPGEYLISWYPRSYINIGVSVGRSGRRKTNNNIERRDNAKINIEKDSIVELKKGSVSLIETGGKL